MAQNTRKVCAAGSWTQLTDASTTGDITIMLADNTPVSLQATADTTTPTDAVGPFYLLQIGDGWSEATIAEKFPGVTSAAYIWAKPLDDSRSSIVSVSHA